jgi:hypothetical protein
MSYNDGDSDCDGGNGNHYGDNDGGDYEPRVRRTRTCEQGSSPLGSRLTQLRVETK